MSGSTTARCLQTRSQRCSPNETPGSRASPASARPVYRPTVLSAAFVYDWRSSAARTLVDRRAPKRSRGVRSPVLAISLAVPSLFAIGLGIAALL